MAEPHRSPLPARTVPAFRRVEGGPATTPVRVRKNRRWPEPRQVQAGLCTAAPPGKKKESVPGSSTNERSLDANPRTLHRTDPDSEVCRSAANRRSPCCRDPDAAYKVR